LDSSPAMLSHAIQNERIRYVEGRAEQMPFASAEFELIAAGLAFHWFDRRQFLLEAKRVLQPEGRLVIYNDVFTGKMKGNDEFETWYRHEYLSRYPSPPRQAGQLHEISALESGFVPFALEEFTHDVDFSIEQLVAYLLTQTNVIAAVETGAEHLESVANWLIDAVSSKFVSARESFSFYCQMQCLKRS